MSIITLYLIVLILALIIGNLLLSVTQPKVAAKEFKIDEKQLKGKKMQKFFKEIKSLNAYLKEMHKRVLALEKMLEKRNSLYSREEVETVIKAIGERLHRLENFKSNAEVEMQAVKEIALEMKNKLKSAEEMEVVIEQLKELTAFRNSIREELNNIEKKLREIYTENENKLANHKVDYDHANARTLEKELETFKKISLKKKGLVE